MKAHHTLAAGGSLAPGALLAFAGSLSDPVTLGLVILVTAVVTAILVLIFRAGNGLVARLFSTGRSEPPPPLAQLQTEPLQPVRITLRETKGDEEGPRLAWSEVFLSGGKRLVILGSPGTGKSTLLDYLVRAFSSRLPDWTHPLHLRLGPPVRPLLARLRELGAEGAGSLQALSAQGGSLKAPRRLGGGGGCLVLLDGLDEVADERRAWAVEEIKRLVAEYPDHYYVITCRTSTWHDQLPGFRTYEIQPFTGDDVRPSPTAAEAELEAGSILRLAGESADTGARIRALRSLGRLKIPFDAEVRQVLEKARQDREPAVKNAVSWAWCELGRPEDLGLVKVPAGDFLMGHAGEDFQRGQSAKPQHLLDLPDFYIGRDLVTVGEFSAFLAASGYELKEKEKSFLAKNRYADHPVIATWTDAAEYARWHGMSLPSEAEWEKAARGTDGRLYPWGDEWKPGHANTLENWPSRGKAATTAVGSFSPQGDSPYGCRDMAGNVWEWTRCLVAGYPYDPYDGREDFGVSLKGWQMLRGGSLDEDARLASCSFREVDDFRTPTEHTGFRVVLIPRDGWS